MLGVIRINFDSGLQHIATSETMYTAMLFVFVLQCCIQTKLVSTYFATNTV